MRAWHFLDPRASSCIERPSGLIVLSIGCPALLLPLMALPCTPEIDPVMRRCVLARRIGRVTLVPELVPGEFTLDLSWTLSLEPEGGASLVLDSATIRLSCGGAVSPELTMPHGQSDLADRLGNALG